MIDPRNRLSQIGAVVRDRFESEKRVLSFEEYLALFAGHPWRYSRDAANASEKGARQAVLKGVNIDDWFFGVSAVSADGWESPVVFPGAPGRWAKDEPAKPAPGK